MSFLTAQKKTMARLVGAMLTFGLLALWSPSLAQFCETSLCRSGESYRSGGEDRDGRYGVCQSSSGLGYQSHYLARCEEGWTLDVDRGVCVRDACTSGACGVLVPLCTPTERYERGGSDRDGAYGVCHSGPAPFTRAESHRLVRCAEGWTLIAETGVCRRDCALRLEIDPGRLGIDPFPIGPGYDPDRFKLRPDLILDRLWLKNASGAAIKSVRAGSAYYLCFVVRNQGNLGSGAFKVRGGGLGIPTNPEQNHAGLAAGASRGGCLFYPVTPSPGRYTVGVTADADNTVAESRENNNGRQITIIVE